MKAKIVSISPSFHPNEKFFDGRSWFVDVEGDFGNTCIFVCITSTKEEIDGLPFKEMMRRVRRQACYIYNLRKRKDERK